MTLDGWRAMAITMVFLAHAESSLGGDAPAFFRSLCRVASFGGLGVDIFFALSGFLICTLILREKQRVGRVSLERFYTRRAFRILPAALFYLATIAFLKRSEILQSVYWSEILASIAFYRNYWARGGWYTGHFWSLAVEEHFYLIIPLMLSRLSRRTTLIVSLVLALASAASRSITYNFGDITVVPHFTSRTQNRFDGLLCGAILAILLSHAPIREKMIRALTPLRVVGLAMLAILAMKFTKQPMLTRTIIAWILPLFLAFTVLRPSTWPCRLMELAPIRWVGRLSYSLYLWQQLFFRPHAEPVALGLIGRLQSLPVALLAILTCAIASYYLVEKPMIRIGHRLAKSPSAPPSRPKSFSAPASRLDLVEAGEASR